MLSHKNHQLAMVVEQRWEEFSDSISDKKNDDATDTNR